MAARYGYLKQEALDKFNHYLHTNYEFKRYQFFRIKVQGEEYYWCSELQHFFPEKELNFGATYTTFLDALDKLCTTAES